MIDQDKIREILKESGLDIEPTAEDFEKSFAEIGLDSLDVFSFLSEIEVQLGKSFSEEEYGELKNLNDVLKLLNS